MRSALDFLATCDLIVTSGGLGPTADDLTAEVVGGFAGRPMVLDEALEERILDILRSNRARWRSYSEEAMRAGNRKQAIVPDGATILEPVGTAPGLVVPPAAGEGADGAGAARPAARAAAHVGGRAGDAGAARGARPARDARAAACCGSTACPRPRSRGRCWRSRTTASALDRLEVTTCLRRGEIEIATVFAPEAEATYDAFAAGIRARHGDTLFSEDGATIDEQIAGLLDGRTIARRRVVHRRADGRAADGAGRLERVRARRRGRLLR